MEGIDRPDPSGASRSVELSAWRQVVVFAVAAVSVVVFVRLGKYLGQRFDISPPLTAALLPIVPTAGAILIAARVLTPRPVVYQLPEFVEEERKKEANPQKPKGDVFADDYFRNWENFSIRTAGGRQSVKSPESAKGSLGCFKKEWEECVGGDVPDDVILFANQRLGAVALMEGIKHLGENEWNPYRGELGERRSLEQKYVVGSALDTGPIIEGYYQTVFSRKDNKIDYFFNIRVVVMPGLGSTAVYIEGPTDEPQPLDLDGWASE